jgi:transaldolase
MKKIIKKIDIYCDGADFAAMNFFYKKSFIKGFTTNPSLMNSSGIKNYKEFSKKALKIIKNKSLSLEVFSDNLNDMERQANIISTWGKNIYVKIPITNTKGKSCLPLVKKLIEKKMEYRFEE